MPSQDAEHDRGKHWNRDNEQKPGAPPRSAAEPKGSEGSTRTDKTRTDPASGEQTHDKTAPSRSGADDKLGKH
jgi:hypothetical protein